MLGFKELDKPRYANEKDKSSEVILNIDTLNEGKFEFRIFLKNSEIVLSPMTDDYVIKDIRKIFDKLKERGICISPIFLSEKNEVYPFPEKPEVPPKLPSSAKKIPEKDWKEIWEKYMSMPVDLRKEWWLKYQPEIGTKGLRTEYGLINGTLIWFDGIISIFDTPQGKIEIPFGEILDPFGVPYGEKRKFLSEKEEEKKYFRR